MKFYFNYVYNPVYDFFVNRITPYHHLQEACIENLNLAEGDIVLCAGVGTGNEILRILETNRNMQIVGIDASKTALRKAQNKAQKHGKTIQTCLMDVQNLQFTDASFNKVVCVHVTDFVKDSFKASAEIIRVLKPGGRFVITFPSGKEDFSFGMNVIGGTIRQHAKNKAYHKIPLVIVSSLLGAIVYIPFLFRSERRFYSKSELQEVFSKLTPGSFKIEDFPVYNDFILHGTK